MTEFPDYFVPVAETFASDIIESSVQVFEFWRDGERFEVLGSTGGGFDGYYDGSTTQHYHIVVEFCIEAAVLPLIEQGWTLDGIEADLENMYVQDSLQILREQRSRPVPSGDEKAGIDTGPPILTLKSKTGASYEVSESLDGYVGRYTDADGDPSYQWIRPEIGLEAAIGVWIENDDWTITECDEAAEQQLHDILH